MHSHYNKAILTKLLQNVLLALSWAKSSMGPGQVECVRKLMVTRGARNEYPSGVH